MHASQTPGVQADITATSAYILTHVFPMVGNVPSALCHDFRWFSTFFLLSPKRPLIQLRSTMTCFHILYLILSHVPFLFILSFIFFRSFQIEGELSHLGLLGLETFGPWEDSTEDYLFWSNVDIPYKGVNPSLGSLLRLGY